MNRCNIRHVIKCVQYEVGNEKNPLLPPNQFVYIDGRTVINVTDPDQAKTMYNTYAGFHCNRYNKRKFVDGALYTDLFEYRKDIIYPSPNEVIELDIAINDTDEHSFVKIFYDMNENSNYLRALNRLGESLRHCKENTNRSKNKDQGKMFIVGKGKKGNGSIGSYNLTKSTDEIVSAINEVIDIAKDYYLELGLSDEINELDRRKNHGNMGNEKCFVSSIVQSQNLVNAGHYDSDDTTVSIATWTESKKGMNNDWYLILPNTTRDGKRGIAIKLHHGVTITWEGTKIFHCSTIGELDGETNVYGTLFGCKD